MSEAPVESEVMAGNNYETFEASVSTLWERARRVSELVLRLRKENKELRDRLREFESLEEDLAEKIGHLKAELETTRSEAQKHTSNGDTIFTNEQKEALVLKITELLAKINSRL